MRVFFASAYYGYKGLFFWETPTVYLAQRLNQYQGGMCIAGVLTTTERTPRHFILPLGPN